MSSFDERATTWDNDPKKVERARVVAHAIRAAVPVAATTRVLEYGAGTGLVSQALADHVGSVTMAEPSAGMRAVMAQKVAAHALPPDARIWDLDLVADEPPAERFDLVVTVMTLHHIREVGPVLKAFAELLDGGGHVCIVDLEQDDGAFHRSDPTFEGHDGFQRESLTNDLADAGFVDLRFEPCYEITKQGETFPLFLATGMVIRR